MLEWECCLEHPEDGAREVAECIQHYIIRVTEKAFDDIVGGATDQNQIKRALGPAQGDTTMAIEGGSDAKASGKIRLGMVSGGKGAFIGAVHRIASSIDDQYELVAGELSSMSDKARSSGEALGLAADRIYEDYENMAKAEAKRADGIEAVWLQDDDMTVGVFEAMRNPSAPTSSSSSPARAARI